MNKWYLFIVSIGLLLIATSPMFSNQNTNLIMGLIIIAVGVILIIKNRKG
ncbi:multidrug transporter [Clostridium sp. D2Q-14]|nr:DUF6131 family protein [Anaeromonas gelatinilytica]MBS4535451.1 multidrug transporter [Anaeromonas gelatinilytica]